MVFELILIRSDLHFVAKVLEKVVMQRLEEHLNEHSLHDPLQFAYKENVERL